MRRAFTLVELLVAIGIALVLATIVVAINFRSSDRDRVQGAADRIQGWVAMARNWALRDRKPVGLRLSHNGNGLVTSLAYIEQLDDWLPGGNPSLQLAGATATLLGGAQDFAGVGFGIPDNPSIPIPPPVTFWPVQVGDFLQVGTGANAQLSQVISATRTALTLRSGLSASGSTHSFRVIRGARPRTGEAPLNLPDNAAIDVNTNGASPWYGATLPTYGAPSNSFDILFTPGGQVLYTSRPIRLWVRDTGLDQPATYQFAGLNLIVSINPQTGMVSTAQVDQRQDPSNQQRYADPYAFARNPNSSGL